MSIFSVCMMLSCATKKEIVYLQDSEILNNTSVELQNPTIQIDDILQVRVTAFPMTIAEPYNRPSLNTNAQNGNRMIEGYLVSPSGSITLPILGEFPVQGKTTMELQNDIRDLLISGGHIVENPIVEVMVMNKKVTVLGEVRSPGVYGFLENNLNVLQALGQAGDLLITGQRENVLLVRQTNGQREVTRLDLTSAEIINSPYFLLKPNDLIYVLPSGPKIKSAGYIGNLGSLLSVPINSC